MLDNFLLSFLLHIRIMAPILDLILPCHQLCLFSNTIWQDEVTMKMLYGWIISSFYFLKFFLRPPTKGNLFILQFIYFIFVLFLNYKFNLNVLFCIPMEICTFLREFKTIDIFLKKNGAYVFSASKLFLYFFFLSLFWIFFYSVFYINRRKMEKKN